MIKLDRSLFPQRPSEFVSINCVPVLYRPILGSPEQFVVGVLCTSAAGIHVERANRLDRLAGLYGDNCEGVLLAIDLALDVLDAAAQVPDFDLSEFRSAVSGIVFGEGNTTEGNSLQIAAQSWLSAHCSLFTPNT
jgi:hypothetical protein